MSNANNPKYDISNEASHGETKAKAKHLQARFMAGAISRRDFISTALALGVSLGGATAVVKQAEAATPKSGGRLRLGITGGATSDVLDPGQILDAYMINVCMGQLRPCMTKIMPDGSTEGDICSDWQASNGARHGNLTYAKALNSTTAKT